MIETCWTEHVSSCSSCPFSIVSPSSGGDGHLEIGCGHGRVSEVSRPRLITDGVRSRVAEGISANILPPKWCPLRQGGTAVTLVEGI